MATIGLSKPYYAKYAITGGKIGYTDGGLLGKAVEVSVQIDTSESNNLYADNGIAESDTSFAGGTLTITTDDLEQEAAAAILGLTANTYKVGAGEDAEQVSELVFDDDMTTPDLGVGFVIKKKKGGAYKYRAIVLHKVKFNIPEDAATTQGETIEWQKPELEAVIMRDDSAKHGWKSEATVESEALAEAYIKQKLDITA